MIIWCEDGRLWQSAPSRDDPYCAVDIGPCPEWETCGCIIDSCDPEAESYANGRDGAVASACERVATSNSPLPDAPKQEKT